MICARPGCDVEFERTAPQQRFCSRGCQLKEREHTGMIHIRLKRDLAEQLRDEAEARDVSVNWLVQRALSEFLQRLAPAEDFTLTR